MIEPSWAERLSAWSTLATALFTLSLVGAAIWAGRTAISTLRASQRASEAATDAAKAAQAANEQARQDSIEQTRPYVYAEIIPGLMGGQTWDLRISNSGKSSARNLRFSYSEWPQNLDDVGASLKELFDTPRTLPPTCTVRAVWSLTGPFDDGTIEAGLPGHGAIGVSYTSDDSSKPEYHDSFDVMILKCGLTPMGDDGPTSGNLSGDAHTFYVLGQALVRRVSELSR